MTNLYAIHGGPSIYALVKADSQKEAFDCFAKSQIGDEHLIGAIHSLSISEGLLEMLYYDDEGFMMDEETGRFPDRLRHLSEAEQEAYRWHHIEENARHFWADTPEYAETYLQELRKGFDQADYELSFSDDFYIETAKRIIHEGEWFDAFAIVEVDLSKDPLQIIYQD